MKQSPAQRGTTSKPTTADNRVTVRNPASPGYSSTVDATKYHAMKDALLRVLPSSAPGTSHGLLVEKPDLCNQIMLDFLTLDPVPTFAPIRRAR